MDEELVEVGEQRRVVGFERVARFEGGEECAGLLKLVDGFGGKRGRGLDDDVIGAGGEEAESAPGPGGAELDHQVQERELDALLILARW